MRLTSLLCISVAFLGLSLPASLAAEDVRRLYLLQFNRWGELTNPGEAEYAIKSLQANPQIKRILILSYGWAHDGENSSTAYREILDDFFSHARNPLPADEVAVIGVGWDSSQTGFRKLFNDLLPLPFIADTLAFLPDKLLFPVSFWSKAAAADRIGMGGLRESLNQILGAAYPNGKGHPELFLIGHSFGTRIVSGLMQDRLLFLPVRGEKFDSAPHVVGAALLQPAAVLPNLHERAGYPVLVTQSRHDRANGFLFPLANLPVNAFGFTAAEGIFRHRVFTVVESVVDNTVGTVAGTVADVARIPKLRTVQRGGRGRYLFLRSGSELLSIPLTALLSVGSLPVNYAYVQLRGLLTRPIDHVMDTLAQLPVVEVGVFGLDHALGRKVAWGSRSKGFFELGGLHESTGRLSTPRILRDLPTIVTPDELREFNGDGDCGLPTCRGVFMVDSSSIVRRGAFNLDFGNPWVDFTLGWLDPIGAHGDYRNAEIMELMTILAERSDRSAVALVGTDSEED